MAPAVIDLGRRPYGEVLTAMRQFTAQRDPQTPDQLWLVEHDPVYTLGLAGRSQHILDAGTTPVIRVERGGQVTYHGPGQAVVYVLLDLRRRALTVRALVYRLEQATIDLLAEFGVPAIRRPGMPGVYLSDASKIAALGLKVSRGCTLHGIALNIAMDLRPFERIHPCGDATLQVTDLAQTLAAAQRHARAFPEVAQAFAKSIADALSAENTEITR